jgi:hypothetical protein
VATNKPSDDMSMESHSGMIQEKIEELREIPFQCHLVNLKSHTD